MRKAISKIKMILALLVVTTSIMGGLSYAQPKTPRERIPSDIPAEVRQQIERLYSADPKERLEAAVHLGRMGEKSAPAIPFLMEVLDDDTLLALEPRIKTSFAEEASQALAKIGEAAVEPLINSLGHKNLGVRKKATEALGKIGAPAVDPLIAALKDEDSVVQWSAIEALGEIQDPRAVKPLIALLKNEPVRMNAVWALGRIGKPAVKALILASQDKDPDVRESVAWVLGGIKDSCAVKPLIVLLKDRNTNVRRSAVWALENIGKPAVGFLIVALKDKYWWVRRSATKILGEIKDSRAVGPLIATLKDENSIVRIHAVEALGKIKHPRAVEPLIVLLKDEDSGVQKYVAEALKEITGKDFGLDPLKWQEWWEQGRKGGK